MLFFKVTVQKLIKTAFRPLLRILMPFVKKEKKETKSHQSSLLLLFRQLETSGCGELLLLFFIKHVIKLLQDGEGDFVKYLAIRKLPEAGDYTGVRHLLLKNTTLFSGVGDQTFPYIAR